MIDTKLGSCDLVVCKLLRARFLEFSRRAFCSSVMGMVWMCLITTFLSPVVAQDEVAFAVADVEDEPVDDEDPFAKIIKLQPGLADHVKQVRASISSALGRDLTLAAECCEATAEERQQIQQHAQSALDGMLAVAGQQLLAQFGGQRVRPAKREQRSHYQQRFDAVEKILMEVYWPGKSDGEPKPRKITAWQSLMESRDQYRRHAHAMSLVVIIDQRLYLDRDQRDALTTSLAEGWDDNWEYYLQIIVHNPQFFPQVPDKLVTPHLTEMQEDQWSRMQKQQLQGFTNWSRPNMFATNVADDEWFDTQDGGDRP